MYHRASLLPWIVAFKAIKAVLLAALGLVLLFSIHADPVELVVRAAEIIHLPLSARLVTYAFNLAFQATPTKEVGLGLAALGYAILMGTEGVGLYLRKSWARWFTIIATGSLIPLEVYEIARERRPGRVIILLLNIAVVVYLVKRKEIFQTSRRRS